MINFSAKKMRSLIGVLALVFLCFNSCSTPVNEGFESIFTEDGCLINLKESIKVKPYKINLYLETSSSMFGFMPSQDVTSFQTTVWDVVSLLHDSGSKNLQMFQLRSKNESPIPINLKTFRTDLNSGLFQSGKQTDIPEMLDSVFAKAHKNSVSIIISDLIFSPEGDAPALLAQFSTDIRSRLVGKQYASDILQLYSQFHFKSRAAIELKSPYYIWILGAPDQVADLSKKIKRLLRDYNEVTHGLNKTTALYSALPFTEANPSVSASPCGLDKRYYVYTEWDGTPSEIKIPLAVNLLSLPENAQSAQHLKKSIEITSASSDVTISSITTRLNFKEKSDVVTANSISASHVINLSAKNLQNESNLLSLNIRNQSPEWIGNLSQEHEDNLRKRTNGLKSLIKGLDDAIPSDPYLLSTPITLLITKRKY